MESTRPIRALSRGFDALTVLNSRDGATVSEVAQEIRLPRTTVYRILETLSDAGYAFRDVADERYRLTIRVRSLSRGFQDESWVSRIAKPCLDELGREVTWPVSLATLSGGWMMLRETTDHQTPLTLERQSAGLRLPLLGSAQGRAYLAFCAEPERDSLLDLLARSKHEEDKPARTQRAELERMLKDIKAEGHATATRSRRLVDEVSASVPVLVRDRVRAVVTVRFIAAAQNTLLDRLLPKLQQCAARIGATLPEPNAPARPGGASDEAA